MAIADLSYSANQVFAGGREAIILECLANGATIKPGYIVKLDTAFPDVSEADATAATPASVDFALGVALEHRDGTDIDTAYADNADIRVGLFRAGTIYWLPTEASAGAILVGQQLEVSNATSGHLQIPEYTTPATPNAAENKTAVDQVKSSMNSHVGIALQDLADVAAVRWIKVLT